MAITVDPQERELRALARLVSWRGRRVLEVGCGDGRLTLRLAGLGARVTAIDPDASEVRKARAALGRRDAQRITYRVGRAERLAYRAHEFDAVVFAWAL
jgi:2-polyprenyl-6-hydroxyphenyl methylase/3-demethylubiquinone-9 3-methyltransferase